MKNIHNEVGWSNCANLRCRSPLDVDHVTLITTAHVRRFCSVECITEGQAAWHQRIVSADSAESLDQVLYPPQPPVEHDPGIADHIVRKALGANTQEDQ